MAAVFTYPGVSLNTTGLATESKQDTQITAANTANTKLNNIDNKIPSQGQSTMAGSLPVVIASNQTAVPVSSTNLDIRDLDFATDKVDVSGSSVTVSSTNLDVRDLVFATDKVDVSGSSVTVTATNLDIRDLTHASDSVKVGDGTNFLAIGAGGELSVDLVADSVIKITDGSDELAINVDGSINSVVTATNLDIRDLTHASDSIKVGDGTDFLAINGDGSINAVVSATNLDVRDLAFATDKVDVSGSSVTVTATNLDIRDLAAAQDNVAISDGTDTLAINGDGSINATVSATNLDIRDLTHASDSVKVGDGTDFLAVNSDGSINVTQAAITPVAFARIDYGSTNVTTGAYVQLISSVGSTAVKEIEIFDSSGETLLIATGGSGSEVDKMYIMPGGNGRVLISIPASTRVAVKAVTATASTGYLNVNFYG